MVARMNVRKSKDNRRHLKPGHDRVTAKRVLTKEAIKKAAEDGVNKLSTLTPKSLNTRVLMTEQQKRMLTSNPNANISLSKKAVKKLRRKVELIQVMKQQLDTNMQID